MPWHLQHCKHGHVKAIDDQLESARQALNESIGLVYWQDITTNPRYTLATVKLEGAASVSTSMPLVILLLTCLLLAAAQGRMVRMQRTQLGTLKALGYSTRELVRQELALPALIALFGVSTGCALIGSDDAPHPEFHGQLLQRAVIRNNRAVEQYHPLSGCSGGRSLFRRSRWSLCVFSVRHRSN